MTLNSGASGHGRMVSAAPPVLSRASSTTVRAPFFARYAAATRPLWPPPTTIASYRLVGSLMAAGYAPERRPQLGGTALRLVGHRLRLGLRRLGLERLGRGVAGDACHDLAERFLPLDRRLPAGRRLRRRRGRARRRSRSIGSARSPPRAPRHRRSGSSPADRSGEAPGAAIRYAPASPKESTASNPAIVRLRTASGVRRCMIAGLRHDREPVGEPHHEQRHEHADEERREPDGERRSSDPERPKDEPSGLGRRLEEPPEPGTDDRPGAPASDQSRESNRPASKCSASEASATMPMPIPRTKTKNDAVTSAAARSRSTGTRARGEAAVLLVRLASRSCWKSPRTVRSAAARRRTSARSARRPTRRRRRDEHAADQRADGDPRVDAHRDEAVRPAHVVVRIDEVGNRSSRRGEERRSRRAPNRTRARSASEWLVANAIARKNSRRDRLGPDHQPPPVEAIPQGAAERSEDSRDTEGQQQRERLHRRRMRAVPHREVECRVRRRAAGDRDEATGREASDLRTRCALNE